MDVFKCLGEGWEDGFNLPDLVYRLCVGDGWKASG